LLLLFAVATQALRSAPGQDPAGERPKRGEAASDQPPVPVEEIIRRFAAQEAEFRLARDNYTYKQSLHVREYGRGGGPGGEYIRKSEIVFTPEGKRFERVTYEPPSTLEQISISPEDLADLENIQPFVLTTEDLPKYELKYRGREQVDEITTYVFQVRPKRIERGQRYFEGTIWVDDRDLQIVKTRGKAVPDIRSGTRENLFPTFETYRENIDGHYWFPTYTRADDVLAFKSGNVRIRVIIRYTEYKQFRVTVRIRGAETDEPAPQKPPER
jgi:hypothetical protein